jgi:hypothetical protein
MNGLARPLWLAAIAVSAASFALREMALRVRHWRSGGP